MKLHRWLNHFNVMCLEQRRRLANSIRELCPRIILPCLESMGVLLISHKPYKYIHETSKIAKAYQYDVLLIMTTTLANRFFNYLPLPKIHVVYDTFFQSSSTSKSYGIKWHIRRGLPNLSITKETSLLVRISSETCSLALKLTVNCCERNCFQKKR